MALAKALEVAQIQHQTELTAVRAEMERVQQVQYAYPSVMQCIML